MLAQRGTDLTTKQARKAKPTTVDRRGSTPVHGTQGTPKRKLSFHEKHALETLPNVIATLQARIGELRHRLEDPTLYARDRAAFTQTSEALVSTQSELSAAEQKWLALEIQREEIEGS
jgi:ATP-binding cassette subfamily F protein uup